MAKTLLIVDDSPIDLAHISKIATKAGYEVVTASSGSEALTKVMNPEIVGVLMDIVMPDGSGFQATRDLRKVRAGIPVIMVSSKNRAPDLLMAKNSGAADYVFKPVEAGDLLEKIKKHIG